MTEENIEVEGEVVLLSYEAEPIFEREFVSPDNEVLTLAVQETEDGRFAIFAINSESVGFVIDVVDDADDACERAQAVADAFTPKESE
jgi:hypothetical protein